MLSNCSTCFILTKPKAGITHVFVNLGSDHPSIIEAIVKGQNEKQGNFPRIITCPNEVCGQLWTRYLMTLTSMYRWWPSRWPMAWPG